MIVRCTTKVLKLLGGRPHDVPASGDDWYLNLLWLDARKNLLLTHSGTLFPVLVADVRKADLRDLSTWVRTHVSAALADEDLPAGSLGDLSGGATVARTASRRVLGCMNQTALEIEYAVARSGGLNDVDTSGLNRSIRRSLHSSTDRRDYSRPLDVVRARAASGSDEAH